VLGQLSQGNCKAEICQLNLPFFQKDVRWFNIPVNVACSMHGEVSAEYLLSQRSCFSKWQYLPLLEMLTKIALAELCHQVGVILSAVRIVKVQDLWVTC
jgi:hypothetical protein